MIRDNLNEALTDALEKYGYSIFRGSIDRVSKELTTVPAAWIAPAKITDIEGRDQGTITYNVNVKLIDIDKATSSTQREETWGEMEQKAIRIYQAVCDNENVKDVENLSCEPKEYIYTAHGEVSLDMEFDVVMRFCESAI